MLRIKSKRVPREGERSPLGLERGYLEVAGQGIRARQEWGLVVGRARLTRFWL